MGKAEEEKYFNKIGKNGLEFTLGKPFVDLENAGSLLSDMAAIFSLMPKRQLKIADMGCGSGWTSNFYALAGHEVVGIDISKTAIRAAKKHFARHNLSFVGRDFDKLKFENEFDVVVFSDSLHHCDDEQKTIASAYHILKPGGLIIICEPGSGHSKNSSSISAMRDYGVSERDMPPKLVKSALNKAGFINIKVYGHPSKLHRVNYKKFDNSKKIVNFSVFRGVLSFAYSTLLKSNHGIVVASKGWFPV